MTKDFSFQKWLKEQKLSTAEEVIHDFHKWMRNSTDLSSGTIYDYRKYIARYLDEDENLQVEEADLTSHERASVSKFRDFSTTFTEGDTE